MRRMAQTPIDKSRLGSQRCANPECWLRLKLSHEVPPLGQVGISRYRSFKTSSLHPHAREALVSERPVPGSHPAMLLPPKVPYPFHRPMTPNKKISDKRPVVGALLSPYPVPSGRPTVPDRVTGEAVCHPMQAGGTRQGAVPVTVHLLLVRNARSSSAACPFPLRSGSSYSGQRHTDRRGQ